MAHAKLLQLQYNTRRDDKDVDFEKICSIVDLTGQNAAKKLGRAVMRHFCSWKRFYV